MSRTPGGPTVAMVLLVAVLSACSRPSAPPEEPRLSWSAFEARRPGLIRDLAGSVLACIDRVDPRARDSAMFHGCGDWHNALAGNYALYTAYRRTGDVTYLRAAERPIAAGKIDDELRFLPQLEHPQQWRRHYGFPWLLAMLEQRDAALALARQRGHPVDGAGSGVSDGGGRLDLLASAAVEWLRTDLAGLDAAGGRERAKADRYVNLSWTLLNMARWARHTGDAALLAVVRSAVDAHLRPGELDTACPVTQDARGDATGFIPPCLMRLATIAELDGAAARGWIDARIPADLWIPPLTAPKTAEAAGLNFHRAAMLLALYEVTGRDVLRDNAATLVCYHAARPQMWRDDYRQHAQWVPQFGIHAIEQSYPSGDK
jgi:hypothetical protein